MRSTMVYDPCLYSSPPRARLSRQAHSYPSEDSPRSPHKDNLLRDSKHKAGSLGRSSKISYHLFPLISKFEALDALSQEIKEPSLRPAPLHTSRKSTVRRGGLDGPTSIKLDQIFSPRTRHGHSCEEVILRDVIASPLTEDVFTSGTLKSESTKMKQPQLPEKANYFRLCSGTDKMSARNQLQTRIPSYTVNTTATRLRGGIQNISTPKENELQTRSPSYTGNSNATMNEQRRNSTVRERIKFFDGNMEQYAASGSWGYIQAPSPNHGSPRTNVKLSLLRNITPTTPTCPKLPCPSSHVIAPRSAAKTTSSKPYVAKTFISETPMGDQAEKGMKRRRPIELDAPNPFSQTPHTHPASRPISPATASPGRRAGKRQCSYIPLYTARKLPDTPKEDSSPEGKSRCSRRLAEPVARRVSSMIKEKKTDRNLETVQRVRTSGASSDATSDRKNFKYTDMRMLRERSVVAKSFEVGPWSLARETTTKIPKPRWQDFTHPAPPISPTRANPSGNTKAASLHPKIQQMAGSSIPSLVRRGRVYNVTPPKLISGSIRSRIKEWDSRAEVRGRSEEPHTDGRTFKSLGDSTASRKSIYENPLSEEMGRELQKRGLDGQEVKAIINEFQDIGGGLENEDSSKGPWKMVVAPRLGRGGLAAQSDTDSSGDIDVRIIVREAQCGLAEPKPLRLLEMKRMILLCRERVKV